MNNMMNLQAFREQLKTQLQTQQEAGPPAGRTKIRATMDKKFDFPDGIINANPFEVIILNYTWVRAYYPNLFKRGVVETPVCWGLCGSENNFADMKPSDNAKDKKFEGLCMECPLGNFTKDNSPECKLSVRLAVIPPDANEETPVWTLEISPKGLAPWKRFIQNLKAPLPSLVTRVGFDPKLEYPCILTAAARDIDPEMIPIVMEKQEEATRVLNKSFGD
jgi:hypothetical protein